MNDLLESKKRLYFLLMNRTSELTDTEADLMYKFI